MGVIYKNWSQQQRKLAQAATLTLHQEVVVVVRPLQPAALHLVPASSAAAAAAAAGSAACTVRAPARPWCG